jgi:hypothetical protein
VPVSAAGASTATPASPGTGADLALGLGGALLASGLGFLTLGARRRRVR